MKNYRIDNKNKKEFSLVAMGKNVGSLKFKNWFLPKVEILLNNNASYLIKSKGFGHREYIITQGETNFFTLKTNWRGHVSIKYLIGTNEENFILKPKKFLDNSFSLYNEKGYELCIIEQNFSWRKLFNNYNILTYNLLEKLDYKDLLLMIITFCMIYDINKD